MPNAQAAMAKHILVKDKQLAEELKVKLAKGEAFDKLAKKYSTCNTAKNGGDLGEVKKGQLVSSVEKVIFKMPIKKVHGPIKSKFGFHLIETYFRD